LEFPRVAGNLFGLGETDALVCVAAAVIVLLALGPVMKRLVPEGSLRDNLYSFHEALGALVLIVMVVRLARRVAVGAPAPDAAMPPVEQRASLWAQYALYALLFVTTVLGWAGTNAYGDPVSVFGLFDFPTIMGKDQPLSDRIMVWHLICGILIGLIVALHIAGALYHWRVKHDRVFSACCSEIDESRWPHRLKRRAV
jgi:cytochrome b561